MNGTYAGIGGAGGAYEDEKAAFALSVEPLNWKVQGARSTTPRSDTPSGCGKKNVGRAHGAQIEHLEPHCARMSVPRDGLYAILRRIMCVCCLLSFNVQHWSDVPKVKLRLKMEEHSIIGCSSLSSSRTSVSFPVELLPAPPPLLERPFFLGLGIYNRLHPLGHLQAPKTLPITIGILEPIPALVAAFLPHGFCYAQARYRRNIAHRTWWAFPRAYPGIGRAGRGVTPEDDKAAFALSPRIGSFRG